VFPVPPLVEVTLPVVLTFEPEVVVVTITLTEHEAPASTVPPIKLTLAAPAIAVNVPPHELLAPGVEATCRPVGKLSVTATPLKAAPGLGFVMASVRLVVPLTAMFPAPNAFVIEGGATTSKLAVLLVAPVPPSVELMAPVVLLFPPAVVPVTFTLIAHEPAAETAPLLKLMAVLPPTAPATVPPQLFTRPGETAT